MLKIEIEREADGRWIGEALGRPPMRVPSCGLLRIGWGIKRQSGSHRTLARSGWPDYVFAFHDGDEVGPRAPARIAKHIGLQPDDL